MESRKLAGVAYSVWNMWIQDAYRLAADLEELKEKLEKPHSEILQRRMNSIFHECGRISTGMGEASSFVSDALDTLVVGEEEEEEEDDEEEEDEDEEEEEENKEEEEEEEKEKETEEK